MATEIYGASDDLIEFEGDVHGECGGSEKPRLVICSDGTLLTIAYGKGGQGIWAILVVKQGSLLREVVPCDDEDSGRYSDTAHFRDGLKWAYVAHEWELAS